MPVNRHEDWEQRLDAAIAARADEPFAWGRHDCCLAACALFEAMTGEDLARFFRGYRTAAGAAKKLAEFGGVRGLAAGVADYHDLAEISPRFAQRGDAAVVMAPLQPAPGLVPGGEAEALGVVALSGRFVLVPAAVGWGRVQVRTTIAAWRIGD